MSFVFMHVVITAQQNQLKSSVQSLSLSVRHPEPTSVKVRWQVNLICLHPCRHRCPGEMIKCQFAMPTLVKISQHQAKYRNISQRSWLGQQVRDWGPRSHMEFSTRSAMLSMGRMLLKCLRMHEHGHLRMCAAPSIASINFAIAFA